MKKYIYLFIIINLLFSTYSQLYSPDIEKAFEYSDMGLFKKAALEFENALPEFKERLGKNDTTYYTLFIILFSLNTNFSLIYFP